jgi:hypothetical protein
LDQLQGKTSSDLEEDEKTRGEIEESSNKSKSIDTGKFSNVLKDGIVLGAAIDDSDANTSHTDVSPSVGAVDALAIDLNGPGKLGENSITIDNSQANNSLTVPATDTSSVIDDPDESLDMKAPPSKATKRAASPDTEISNFRRRHNSKQEPIIRPRRRELSPEEDIHLPKTVPRMPVQSKRR